MKAVIQKTLSVAKTFEKHLECQRWILPSFLSVILFILSVRGIENFNQLLLYDDEFGYWTASAYLTGTDWKSVTSGIPYYSYGYGFLILTPIRLLFAAPETMYRAAIVANALFLVGSYWLARNVAGRLFEEKRGMLLDVVCFVVMLYPSNLVFSHIAWAECLLVFLFWIFVWVSLRVVENPGTGNHIGLAFAAMGLYVVHQRTIAVLIATVMIMIWCWASDKSRRRYILAFAVTLGVLVAAHSLIKSDLINDFYRNNVKVDVNNMEGQIDKLGSIFTGEGFVRLFESIIGKWFYLFVSTLMMAWWGAEALLRNACSYCKSGFANFKKRTNGLSADVSLWYTWLLLAFAGNFLISAIYMNGVGRNDMLLYGRYTEYMIGIYFVIGIMSFLRDENWLSKLMAYVLITLCAGLLCQKILDDSGLTGYQAYHSVCTSLFLKKGSKPDGAVLAYAAAGFSVSVAVIICLKAKPWKRWNRVRYAVAAGAVVTLFTVTAYQLVFGVMTEKQCLRIVNIKNIVSWIDMVDDGESRKVYYCSDTESRYWSESFQFLLQETPLTVIKSDQISDEEDAFYIVGKDYLQNGGGAGKFYCIKESSQFAVIVNRDGELARTAREIKGE